MKVLIAPDKLKGSLSAREAANAIARGALVADPTLEVDRCPLADGGEGTLEIVASALGARITSASVLGPRGAPLTADFACDRDGGAIIESAQAIGMSCIAEDARDPLRATSYGLGQLIAAALDRGARRILIGLGGSATSDGGAGMAQALGVRFEPAPTPIRAIDLARVTRVDLASIDPRLQAVAIEAACDVDSPLLGASGAARLFAPQKGASESDVAELERALAHWATLVPWTDPNAAGAGAAGGLGFGLQACSNARLMRGAELVLDVLEFDRRLATADLLITGEGRLDRSSLAGKAAIAAARRARERGVPAIALVGECTLEASVLAENGIAEVLSIQRPGVSRERAFSDAASLLADLARDVIGSRA